LRLGALVIVAKLTAAIVAAHPWTAAYPTYVNRYRLTIAVEIDGERHTGSSVIEVRWTGRPKIGDAGPFVPRVLGQAAVVDLGSKGVIVAALFNGVRFGIAPDGAVDATFLAARAFGNNSTHSELPALEHLRGRMSLREDNFPRLIWFKDPKDLKSAHVIKADEIGKLLASDAKLSAYVEITNDSNDGSIAAKLPWYPELEKRQRSRGVLSWPGEVTLSYPMFGGED
jgi:hypothetical protein